MGLNAVFVHWIGGETGIRKGFLSAFERVRCGNPLAAAAQNGQSGSLGEVVLFCPHVGAGFMRVLMSADSVLPQLVTLVELPWMLSTSVTDFRVAWHENGDAVVLADVYLGSHGGDEFRRVRLDFRTAAYVLTCGWYKDYCDIANGAYCWSLVRSSPLSISNLDEQIVSFAVRWADTGACPDPHVYIIKNSKLAATFSVAATHFLLAGPESYIEIIAQSFDWSWFSDEEFRAQTGRV